MNDILNTILATKATEVASDKKKIPLHEIRDQAEHALPTRPFITSITEKHAQKNAAVIAEIKKASPSKGVILEDFHPNLIATAYEEGGAACLSVLTDQQYFQGSADYLRMARSSSTLPILRKDFMIDVYQIYQARAWGADAILLIASALDAGLMRELEAVAHELGMAVLLELHDEVEIDKCQDMQTLLWGVNNRNLRTFEVNLKQTIQLLPQLAGKIVVTESGITGADDIVFMKNHGVHTFLVGEQLMRSANMILALNELVKA